MQEIGESLISVLVVGKDGLVIEILTRDSDTSEEKKFIGAFSSLVEVVLKKITKDFDLGTFGAGTFDTDRYRFIFCESGLDYVLVTILKPETSVDSIFPYTYLAADKVARIFAGLPVSPVIPTIKSGSDVQVLTQKIAALQKRKFYPSNYVYKLSLIGDGGVGKTSIVQRYVNGIFFEDYKATIGTFISKKEVNFEDINTFVRFMIWDLAGQSQFKRIWPDYLTDSNAGIIVFDITSRNSFENVGHWYELITKVASPHLILLLVGNKIDLVESRKVSKEEAKELAVKLNIYYLETSAKTNVNLEEVFKRIALQLMGGIVEEDFIQEYIDMEKIKADKKYLINNSQLNYLIQFFVKQLDYAIEKKEAEEFIKCLDLLKEIEREELKHPLSEKSA